MLADRKVARNPILHIASTVVGNAIPTIMKTRILLIIILYVTTVSNSFVDDIWSKIENKTWFSQDPILGSQIVFLKNKFDEKKAIIQLHGSGCIVISTIIYDVEINNNIIELTFSESTQNENKENQILKFQYSDQNKQLNEIEGKLSYKIISEEPLIYKLCAKKVDIEALKNDTITMNNFNK